MGLGNLPEGDLRGVTLRFNLKTAAGLA